MEIRDICYLCWCSDISVSPLLSDTKNSHFLSPAQTSCRGELTCSVTTGARTVMTLTLHDQNVAVWHHQIRGKA